MGLERRSITSGPLSRNGVSRRASDGRPARPADPENEACGGLAARVLAGYLQ
jgi:hypothetical protein